ncbi:MAG: carboxypeptidase-like regulatory domain-containing protein, partial [Bacteroidota bacterium]|nr:carboxypeptidase-like regulatory domain-containing protein [Bacteroidota bacterium]
MKTVYLTLISLYYTGSLFAQFPSGGSRGGQSMNVGHFYGKVVDNATGKPIEAASVQLTQNKMDTVTKKRRNFIVAAMLTDKKGEFSIEQLPVIASYQLMISSTGHKPYNEKVAFDLKMNGGDMSQMLNAVDKDLGNIKLEEDAQQLQAVVVTANTSL